MCVVTTAVGVSATTAAIINATMAAVSVAATVASTVISVESSQAQGEAAEKQAEYEYEVSKYEAELERQAGEFEQIKHGVNARRAYGTKVAQAGAFGSDLSFGTTAESFTELRAFQAIEQETIAHNAQIGVNAANMRGTEAIARGRNAQMASRYETFGAAFAGVAQTASLSVDMYTSGAFSKPNTDGLSTSGATRLTAGQRVKQSSGFRNRIRLR